VSPDLPNLFFCGAGPHPGAGIPGVLASGKIVADLVGPATTARRHVPAPQPATA
jgi:phytoene desaturase